MRTVVRWGFSAMMIAVLAACSGAGQQAVEEKADVDEFWQTALSESAEYGDLASVGVDSEVCSGTLVPPQGHRQETAFVPLSTPNAAELAAQTARERLRDLICKGYRCEQAEEIIRIWRVAEDGR